MRRCAGIGVAARDRPVACYVAAIAGPVGRGIIHRALVDAVAWRYIVDNPASRVKPPKRPRTRRQVWSVCPDEMQTFLSSPQSGMTDSLPLFLLELTTGIRRGQVCGLRWEIHQPRRRGEVSKSTTTALSVVAMPATRPAAKRRTADKTIAIDRTTVNALRSGASVQRRRTRFFGGDYHPGNYVFTFEDGRPPHPDTIRQRFDRLAAAAGLSRITFHDLRHSYATGALKSGVSPKILSERIGHATSDSSCRPTPT